MDAYGRFAEVYDTFMDDVPYEKWCDFICGILREHGIRDGLVLDLACGTGAMTRLLKSRGYDMIGVDASGEMLQAARDHEDEGILYLQQDMREFELYGTVRAVVCVCDSMNYILSEEDLERVFSLVNNYLDPNGIFIFDMNTVYKYRVILGDTVICENRESECFTWENWFDEESFINEYVLNFFVQTTGGLYERFEEVHYQRAYETEAVAGRIRDAGMKLLMLRGEDGSDQPEKDSERVWFVAQEHGKICPDSDEESAALQ